MKTRVVYIDFRLEAKELYLTDLTDLQVENIKHNYNMAYDRLQFVGSFVDYLESRDLSGNIKIISNIPIL